MSENWKNNRAEASMREFDKENMAKAAEKRKNQELRGKWTVDVTTKGEHSEKLMDSVVNEFVALTNGKTANLSVDFHPVIEPTNIDDEWSKIEESLYVGDSETDREIRFVISMLKEDYNLPTLKK